MTARPGRIPAAICFLAIAVMASTVASAYRKPMRFERLGLDEGLAQSTVMAIHQDRAGFLWVGTEDGLDRYDGRGFRHQIATRAGHQPLGHEFVWTLVEDAGGNLWMATDGSGLLRLDRETGELQAFRHRQDDPNTIASDHLRVVALAPDGTVWIGTREAGLDHFDPETLRFDHFRHAEDDSTTLPGDEIVALTSDLTGALWVATRQGLGRLDGSTGTVTRFRHDPADASTLAIDELVTLFVDRRGALWIGTYGGGLNRMDPATGRVRHYRHDPSDPASLGDDRVHAVLEDSAGRLWVGTSAGLDLLDPQTGAVERHHHDPADPASLSDDEVLSLFEDAGGLLWIGTRSGGLNRWNPRTWDFGHYTTAPDASGLSGSNVTSFSEDALGRLWVGTLGDGLNIVDRGTGRVQTIRARRGGLTDDRVMSLLHDTDGAAWIGTMTGGLHRRDAATGSIRNYRHDPANPRSLGADGVMALFRDGLGDVWVGTYGGGAARYRRDRGDFERYSHDPDDPTSLGGSRVTAFAEDLTGALWIGTDGGGLSLLDRKTGTFRRFVPDESQPGALGSSVIYALHVDPRGVLWIGTRGAGLARLVGSAQDGERIRFTHYAEAEGLPDDVIYGIESGPGGLLWLSTNNGLASLDPDSGRIHNFRTAHGLQSREFNFGAHFSNSQGELFFGGANGFNAFSPAQLRDNDHPPPVVLTSFIRIDQPANLGRPHHLLDRIDLGYRDDMVTFEFAALDYTDPGANQYSVRLEGFDEGWVNLGTQNRVTYTNLDQGDYVLRVRAANSDGVWNQEGLSLPLAVEPAPWETSWAYAGYLLALLTLVGGIWRVQWLRLRREALYSRRLEEEVSERTHELAVRNADLQTANRKLTEASLTDPLTGLRNRRFLFEQVAKDIAMVRRRYYEIARGIQRFDNFDMIFMMVDLDNFKTINDTCGHEAGDRVLLQVRTALLQACRKSDIIIRWGGDEFLIIGRDSDVDQAKALAERIREGVEQEVFTVTEHQVVRTTCSIGFACFPFVHSQPDFLAWEQVLAMADNALYQSKLTRDTWTGFLSTETSVETPGFFRILRDNPQQLREQGALEVHSSAHADLEVAAETPLSSEVDAIA